MITKCWNCRKATGRCPWSKNLQPIKGWEAIPTRINCNNKNLEEYSYNSYKVINCPLFIKDKLTINDVCKILKISTRTYYRWKSKNTLYQKLKEFNINKFDICYSVGDIYED